MIGVDRFALFFQDHNFGLIRGQSGSKKGLFFFKLTQTCVGLIESGVDALQVVLFGRNVFQKMLQVRPGFRVRLGGLGLFTKIGKSEVTKRIKRPPRTIILVLTHTTLEITNSSLRKTFGFILTKSSLGKTLACIGTMILPFWFPRRRLYYAHNIPMCSIFAIHYREHPGPSDRNYLQAPAEPFENWRFVFYLTTFLLFVHLIIMSMNREPSTYPPFVLRPVLSCDMIFRRGPV
jgi:ABC-type multidrug transport system fused ATPase/permease subunit